jgi:hypothetical protein
VLSEGGRSFLEMASEITYAEVRITNESDSLDTYSKCPAGKTKQKETKPPFCTYVDWRIKEWPLAKLGGICE